MESSWRNTCFRMLHCLNLLFTVSCLLLTMPIILCFSSGMPIELGHFTLSGASPSYPSSASTLSNGSSHVIKLERKISRSFFSPGKNGPFIQQMSPVKIFNATSYLSPDEFVCFCVKPGSRKSVPSTLRRQSLYLSPLYLFSSMI